MNRDGEISCADVCFFNVQFRKHFFVNHMDTLIFVDDTLPVDAEMLTEWPLITGRIAQPLSKKILLSDIFPQIAVTVF